jgi:hypothetical protein
VSLHPYQLQSLAFMQQAEKLEGGWRQLLWRWLPSQPQQQQQAVSTVGVRGQGMWWSPVLDRLSFSVPPAPWGGFLGGCCISLHHLCSLHVMQSFSLSGLLSIVACWDR